MTNHVVEAEALLTLTEVAALFRVDRLTVTRWARAGKLPSLRTLGGHRRYRESEVRGLLGRGGYRLLTLSRVLPAWSSPGLERDRSIQVLAPLERVTQEHVTMVSRTHGVPRSMIDASQESRRCLEPVEREGPCLGFLLRRIDCGVGAAWQCSTVRQRGTHHAADAGRHARWLDLGMELEERYRSL